MEHLGQPVKGGIGVATPETLDKGTRRVVVIIPSPIINNGLLLDAFGSSLQGNANASLRAKGSSTRGDLKGIKTLSGIAVTDRG